jgi:hypothetical protein
MYRIQTMEKYRICIAQTEWITRTSRYVHNHFAVYLINVKIRKIW